MSQRGWQGLDRVLLIVVVALAVLAVIRLSTREAAPGGPPQQTSDAAPPPVAAVADHRPATGTPTSPAGAELLTRIHACSEKDLAVIVDRMSGAEAYGLYHQLSATDRQAVFAALPAPILARKAHELLGVPEHCLLKSGKPGALASSLVDAALGVAGDQPGKELVFTTVVDAQEVPQDLRRSFRPDERKIYACLDAGADASAESGVLVRWTDEGSGALVHLHYQPLTASRRWNYVYFEVTGAWNPGTYRVRFYRVGASAGLLAEGTYTVAGE